MTKQNQDRNEKLAKALKENLAKRKAQSRERGEQKKPVGNSK